MTTDSKARDERTTRTLAWRNNKLGDGFKRQETFFEIKTITKLKKIAKEEETTVAGLIRKIVEDWLKVRK